MNDSNWPTPPPEFSLGPRPLLPGSPPPIPSKLAKKDPSTSAASRTRRSWLEMIVLVAFALAGTVGLARLAHHVTARKEEGNGGIIVRSEVISLWMHPALFDLAYLPHDAAARRSFAGYRKYIEDLGQEKAWYVITVKGFQANGETIILTTVRRPYEMLEPLFPEFLDILALAAAKPPTYPATDFSRVKVGVIPTRLLNADPCEALSELSTLEPRPSESRTHGRADAENAR
jgi:hypothetical protein